MFGARACESHIVFEAQSATFKAFTGILNHAIVAGFCIPGVPESRAVVAFLIKRAIVTRPLCGDRDLFLSNPPVCEPHLLAFPGLGEDRRPSAYERPMGES